MRTINALTLVLLIASTLAAGCVISPAAPTPTPTPVPTATPAPTPVPTFTATPGPSLPLSPVYMPNETTNGRTYPNTTIPAVTNGSKNGGQMTGELGRQR